MSRATDWLVVLFLVSSMTLFATLGPRAGVGRSYVHSRIVIRQGNLPPIFPPAPSSSTTQITSTSSPPISSSDTSTSTSQIPPSSTTPSSTSTSNTPSSTSMVESSSSVPPSSSSSIILSSTSSSNSQHTVIETDVVSIFSSSTTSSSSTATSTNAPTSSGAGNGTIIGLSVAGGIALLGIVGFFVWKFTHNRNNDYGTDDAIKWPELNTHGGSDIGPLPANPTGQAGFGSESEYDLNGGRNYDQNYNAAYADSQANFHGGQDPYAVPPMPHVDHGQGQYYDEPGVQHMEQGGGAYYDDPYQGQHPALMRNQHDPANYQGEAYPMQQLRGTSPGPQGLYDAPVPPPHDESYGTHGTQLHGRGSPAAHVGRQSPGAQQAYAGNYGVR